MTVSRLIATDEAGYGPTLGPLVIAASVWRLPSQASDLQTLFAPYGEGFDLPPLGRVRLADSKELYSSRQKAGLSLLAAGMAAVFNQANFDCGDDFALLRAIADDDWACLQKQQWYRQRLEEERQPLLDESLIAEMKSASETWSARRVPPLHSLRARVIEPVEFNRGCKRAGNKASLLTESALRLVGRLVRSDGNGHFDVWCDKHGGRNRYAAVLLNEFPEALLTIHHESRAESRYSLRFDETEIDIRFTAKGDGFAPVAFSSMVAKYVRERLMARFNRFWNQYDAGLRPTAGYASDALRFLNDIKHFMEPVGIKHEHLVRSR